MRTVLLPYTSHSAFWHVVCCLSSAAYSEKSYAYWDASCLILIWSIFSRILITLNRLSVRIWLRSSVVRTVSYSDFLRATETLCWRVCIFCRYRVINAFSIFSSG